MADIKLSDNGAFDLLLILQTYIERMTELIEQAIKDEKAGKKTVLFDNYTDFIAGLEAYQNKAKKLMKVIRQQTDTTVINEQAIDRL